MNAVSPTPVVLTLSRQLTNGIPDQACAGHYFSVLTRVLDGFLGERLEMTVATSIRLTGAGDATPSVLDELVGVGPAFPASKFGEFVPARVADVRWRMLQHLGVASTEVLDGRRIRQLDRYALTATDWWLLVTRSTEVGDIDPWLAAFAAGTSGLDRALNRLADGIAGTADVQVGR